MLGTLEPERDAVPVGASYQLPQEGLYITNGRGTVVQLTWDNTPSTAAAGTFQFVGSSTATTHTVSFTLEVKALDTNLLSGVFLRSALPGNEKRRMAIIDHYTWQTTLTVPSTLKGAFHLDLTGDDTQRVPETDYLVKDNRTYTITFQEQTRKMSLEEVPVRPFALEKTGDLIEVDATTVRFLFRTNVCAAVQLYLGTSEDNLPLVMEAPCYSSMTGLTLNNLVAGTTYVYKVKATQGEQVLESGVHSFIKNAVTDTPDRSSWARTAVFYEIYVRSFRDSNGDGIGDIKGVEQQLPYLQNLGITALWLMPVHPAASAHGYDIRDHYTLNPDYGTMADFESFMAAAHQAGIKVIIDFVANHTDQQHPWFQSAKDATPNGFTDYYVWFDAFDETSDFRKWHKLPDGRAYEGVFWSGMPDLNIRNQEVREELKKIARFWMDKGVDGFRLDAAKHVDEQDAAINHNWWQEFTAYVKSVKPDAYVVGEVWVEKKDPLGDTAVDLAPYVADYDASFDFSLMYTIEDVLGAKKPDVVQVVQDVENHYGAQLPTFLTATFQKNHDMERVASWVNGDITRVKLSATCLFTLPGTPFVYYGEELGQLGKKPDANCREPMDWFADFTGPDGKTKPGMTTMASTGSSMQYTFADDGISVEEQDGQPDSVLTHYRTLISIRKEHPVLFTGALARVDTPVGTYGYTIRPRQGDGETLTVVHNVTANPVVFTVMGDAQELLGGTSYGAGTEVTLAGWQSLILR